MTEPGEYAVDAALKNFTSFMLDLSDFGQIKDTEAAINSPRHAMRNTFLMPRENSASRKDLLQGMSIIASWGALEAYVEDFCKAVLAESPHLISGELFAKMKVPVTDLFIEGDQRIHTVFRLMQTQAGSRAGSGQFESLLKFIGLDAGVPPEIAKGLHSAQCIRHIWAHKTGIADQKFIDEMPHLGLKVGDRVRVSDADEQGYFFSIISYGHILNGRYHLVNGRQPIDFDEVADYFMYRTNKELFGMDIRVSAPTERP